MCNWKILLIRSASMRAIASRTAGSVAAAWRRSSRPVTRLLLEDERIALLTECARARSLCVRVRARAHACASAALQELPQQHRAVALLVARGVDQRHRSLLYHATQQLHRHGVVAQLAAVAPLELGPLGRVVREPLAQLRRGRDLLEPQVHRRPDPGHAARPEPLDEHALAVRTRGFVVSALQADRHARAPSPARPGACAISSRASSACAYAPPARISAATQIASMICSGVAPFWMAVFVWLRMQYGHCVTCATATAISCLVFASSAPSAKTLCANARNASICAGASRLRCSASSLLP